MLAILSLVIELVLLTFIFYFVYKQQHKKYNPEIKIENTIYIIESIQILLVMFVINFILSAIIGELVPKSDYSGIVDVVPLIFGLLGGYFVFKKMLVKHSINEEKSKKISNQTIVFYVLIGVLLHFLLGIILGLFGTNNQNNSSNNYSINSNDTRRISDMNLINKGIEDYYLDNNEYPENLIILQKNDLLNGIPKDPDEGNNINDTKCGYKYEKVQLKDDKGFETGDGYILSSCFDNKLYLEKDFGKYKNRYEIGKFNKNYDFLK